MNDDTPFAPRAFDTLAIRAGTQRSQFNEHSEALFLTSSFTFGSAAEAAGMFAGTEDGFVYSRFSNPTVRMFEQRLAALEGADDCLATASGMAAILSTALAVLKAGDHVVCSANVFGATVQLFSSILGRFGIDTTYVRGSDPAAWRAAITPRTRLLYCETPSNPLMEIVDLAQFAALGRESARSAWSTTASARRRCSGRSTGSAARSSMRSSRPGTIGSCAWTRTNGWARH